MPERAVDLDELHKNLAFANQFRLEGVKHMITLAAGAIIFTVTFRKDFLGGANAVSPIYAALGWIALCLSIALGVLRMRGWELFYMSYRSDFAGDRLEGDRKRKDLIFWVGPALIWQIILMILGLGLLAAYCIIPMFR